jgi:uncharacterized protein
MKKWILTGLLASVVGLLLWAFWLEQTTLEIRSESLVVHDWPRETPQLKIALLSDLHVGSPHWGLGRLSSLVKKVNAKKPDIILLAGDYLISGIIGGTYIAPKEIGPILARLEASQGVFAVLGNHDWWEDGPGMIMALNKAGITVLENQQLTLTWANQPITLIGVADDSSRSPDVNRTLASHIALPNAFIIALTHDPGIYTDIKANHRLDLMLAGHSHGGQVNLPFFGRLFVPGRASKLWAYGWAKTPNGPLFVTSGIGTSILPVRFRQPPEFVVFTLTPSQ